MALERVQRLFTQLRELDDDPELPHGDRKSKRQAKVETEANAVFNRLRGANQKALLETPRRGCTVEWVKLFDELPELLDGVREKDLVPKGSALQDVQASELWREAECLALGSSSHSMARLKQLPELQQIIAHTSIDAIHACAGNMLHLFVCSKAAEQRRKQEAREMQKTEDKRKQQQKHSAADDDWIQGDERIINEYRVEEKASNSSLLQLLTPALRLCLAAEVAVGMLCPGQSAPPDTPEHAAALQMFIAEACKHVEAELLDTASAYESTPHNIPSAIEELWSGPSLRSKMQRDQQQQHSDQDDQGPLPLPKLRDVSNWDLAPHMDLHMQLPPHQQLEMICQASQLARQQQQQRHTQKQTGQCEQEVEHSLTSVEPGSIGSFNFAELHCTQQHMLLNLLKAWHDAADLHAAAQDQANGVTGSSSSSSKNAAATETSLGLDSSASKGAQQQEQSNSLEQQLAQQLTSITDCDSASENQTQEFPGSEQQQQQQKLPFAQSCQQAAANDGSSVDSATSHSSSPCTALSGASRSSRQQQQHLGATEVQNEPSAEALIEIARAVLVKFLQDQWCSCGDSSGPAWQQAVPLQVLLLTAQLQQLECLASRCNTALITCSESVGNAENGGSCSHVNGAGSSSRQCGQQEPADAYLVTQMLPQLLGMLQAVRQFAEYNASINDTATASQALNGTSNPVSSHGSVQSTGPIEPAKFFSSSGPLASGIFGFVEPQCHMMTCTSTAHCTDLGRAMQSSLQQQQACATSCSYTCSAYADLGGKSSSNGSTANSADSRAATATCWTQPDCQAQAVGGPHVQPGVQTQLLQQQAWKAVLGSCAWRQLSDNVNQQVANHLYQPGALPRLLQELLFGSMREFCSQASESDISDAQKSLSACAAKVGLEVTADCAQKLMAAPHLLQQHILKARLAMLNVAGINTRRWEVDLHREQRKKDKIHRLLEQYGHRHEATGIIVINSEQFNQSFAALSESDDEDDAWDLPEPAAAAAAPAGDGQHMNGCSINASTAKTAAAGAVASGSAGRDRPHSSNAADWCGAGTEATELKWDAASELEQGRSAIRKLGSCIAQQFSPLYQWHMQWLAQYKQQTEAAKKWWESSNREKLAAQGATGQRSAPVVHAAGSSDGAGWLSSGPHDYSPDCPLCKKELEQKQQQDSSNSCSRDSSSSSNIFSQPPVPYSDPFMWRRLLWQLLGKLSPQAQAFYAQYLAMCAHCSDQKVWSWVCFSIFHSLWSSQGGDPVEQQLSCATVVTAGKNYKRPGRLRQYARALNNSYIEGYDPRAPLMAQQLLLALSPLHQQLLPRPETAFLCPSSFSAAIGKALQQQLFSQQGLLDMFQHHSTQLHMWHVWWHLGIRRYAAMQQQRMGVDAVAGAAWLDPAYLDPDARLFAVGFANRQLTGAASYASSNVGCNSDVQSDEDSSTDSSEPAVSSIPLSCSAAVTAQAGVDLLCSLEKHTLLLLSEPSAESGGGGVQRESAEHHTLVNTVCAQWHLGTESEAVQVLLKAVVATEDSLFSSAALRQLQQQMLEESSSGLETVVKYLDEMTDDDAVRNFLLLRHYKALAMLQPSSAVEEVALLPPAPLEALVAPDVWVLWQDKLLRQDNQCDGCSHYFDDKAWEQGVECPHCGVAEYCSADCMARDSAGHGFICKLLTRAAQRYNPLRTGSCSCSKQLQACSCSQPRAFSSLLRLLQPCGEETWPLAVEHGALQRLPVGVLPPELWLQETGRAFGDVVKLANISESANQATLNPWMHYKT